MKNAFLDNAWQVFGASADLTSDTHIVTVTDALDMLTANLRNMEKGQPTGYDIPVDYDAIFPVWKDTDEKERGEILTEVKSIFKSLQHELGNAVAAGDKVAFDAIIAPHKDVE